MTIKCSECPNSSTPQAVPNDATITWHPGWPDAASVCKRCYQRLYMRERREGRQRPDWRS